MSFKSLINKVKPKDILGDLNKHLIDREEENRSKEWHPSHFGSMCVRADIIKHISGIQKELPGPKLKRIFDIGTAVHEIYQNKYFGPMGILWGKWLCLNCHLKSWGFMPEYCNRCSHNKHYYLEIPIKAQLPGCEWPIVSRCDGLLYYDGWIVLEIKSANQNSFQFLKAPYESALIQSNIYGELIRQGFVDTEKRIPTPMKRMVLYVNKNTGEEKPFIDYLDREIALTALKKPLLFEQCLREHILPKRECPNKSNKYARRCAVKTECFYDRNWEYYDRRKQYIKES